MRKIIFLILFFISILVIPIFSGNYSYILIKGKATSFKDFDKKYLKLDSPKNILNKKYKIIKNHFYYFDLNNSFSYILPDPYEKEQTWLNLINAKNADKISTGKGILIGILDSGVELNHEDLKGQIIDYYNVADNNTDVTDYIGHGTSVAGIMAAIAHNGNGIIGLAPDAKYIMVKIAHGWDFTFDDYSVAKGIYYLVDKGCKIINMSIQMTQESQIVDDAIEYAKSKGVILVAATGNNGMEKESFPASNPYVLGVGSVNEEDKISNFSNYDNNTFIFSIGENILTTYINNNYTHQTGTSFSAPMLTGLIGDLLSLNPYLTLNDIKKIILNSTTKYTTENDFKILDFNNSLYSTGIKIIPNKEIYFPGNSDSLKIKMIFPPMSNYFNLILGFFDPFNNLYILEQNDNNFYWTIFNGKYAPTCKNIILTNFLEYYLFGDNGIFPAIKIDNNISPGAYKFCATYEKNGKFLGYLKCKSILILK